MASWRWFALVGVGALAFGGCSGNSSGDDDDGSSGESSGGTSGTSGTGGTGGTGGNVVTTPPKPCGALSSTDASLIATDNLAGVLHATVEATRFLEGSKLIERGLNAGADGEPLTFADDAHESIDEWVDDLRTNVFPDANVESQTENSVTFHLTPEVNCPLDEDYFSFDPEGATLEQQNCADDLAAHPVRYTVSRIDCDAGDVVSVAVEIGESRIKPGLITLSPSTLTLGLDVAETLRAVQEDDPSAAFDEDSGGIVSARLEVLDPELVRLSASIETSLVIGALGNDEPLRLTVRPSKNAFDLTASSSGGTLVGAIDLLAMDATFPFHNLIETAFNRDVELGVEPSDTVQLHVPALSTGFNFDTVAERLVLFELGLGLTQTTVRNGDNVLLTVDVNQNDGRTLTLPIGFDQDDQLQVSATPSFTLDLGYSLASVADKVVELEPFAFEDHVRLALAGDSPSATLLKDAEGNWALLSRATGPALRMDAGNFELSSEAYPDESVSVEGGQCMLFDGSLDGEHDILRGYYAGDCE